MNIKTILLVVIVAIIASFVTSKILSDKTYNSNNMLDTVLEKGKIRAAYLVYPPYFIKDTKTGKFSGIFYDITELLGKKLDLKVEWTEEVGFADIFTGLDSGRYDVFAGGLWPGATRAKAGYFSTPVFYSLIKAWGRADDHRFDNNLAAINSPNVHISTIDGAMEDIIAKADFEKAQRESLPQLSPFTQNFLNITSGKADVTFAEPSSVHFFLKNNPGTLREIAPNQPLRIFGNSLVLKRGEDEFKQVIDAAIDEAVFSGEIDKILKKYESSPDEFPRPALPYAQTN